MKTTLGELFKQYGSDKENHGYGELYEKYLPSKVNKFIEIGTWKGGSIQAFREYYNNEGEFHTLNISFGGDIITLEELHKLKIIAHEGNQSDINYLCSIHDKFDVWVDDGSHHSDEQVISFKHLFLNNMPEHGLYVIEDVFGHKDAYWRRNVIANAEDTIMGVMRKYLNGGTLTSQLISEQESNQLMSIMGDVNIHNDQIIFINRK